MLTPLGLEPSFGFGDRLGLATPGHIAAVKSTRFNPIFAQQSVRENLRTGRTPQDVMDTAKRAVESAGWDADWGADADHLKSVDDLPSFVNAGYTFFTIDPGEFVDNAADTDPINNLAQKLINVDLAEFEKTYIHNQEDLGFGSINKEILKRAIAKYGKAISHTEAMYRRLSELKDHFDFEVSVDETDSATSPFEHYFIANELIRKGVKFTSLAPRFIGRFEKGVDYIGDLQALDLEFAKHAKVTAYFGTYKISLHSGSDKFSVYPLLVKHWGKMIHVKTAGTSYLEALRTLAQYRPELFGSIWKLGLERYDTDRLSYHVSADPLQIDVLLNNADLLDNFHAREILHVTFGSAITHYGAEINEALITHKDGYLTNLKRHFCKHLDLLR